MRFRTQLSNSIPTLIRYSPLVIFVFTRTILFDADGILEFFVNNAVGVWFPAHEPLL